MFHQISFKQKVIASFLIPVVILSIFLGLLVVQTRKFQNLNNQINNESSMLATRANEMRISVIQVQQWLTDISATRAAAGFDDGFAKASGYKDEFYRHLKFFKMFYTERKDQKHLATLARIETNFDEFYKNGVSMAKIYIKDGPQAGNAFMESFDVIAEKFEDDFGKYLSEVSSESKSQIEESNLQSERLFFYMKIIGAICLGTIIFSLSFLTISLNKINFQFKEIGSFASELQKGNLLAKMNINTKDEVGLIAKEFNHTIEFIQKSFNSDSVNWVMVAKQKENELKAQEEVRIALKHAEEEKKSAMEQKVLVEQEKLKAIEAMAMASEEKAKAEQLAQTEKLNADHLKNKIDEILSAVTKVKAGDLTCTIKNDGDGPINHLANTLNDFFKQLSVEFSQIGNLSKMLSEQSATLEEQNITLQKTSNDTKNLSSEMKSQTSNVTQNIKNLSHSTNEMKQAVSEIAKQANLSSSNTNLAVNAVKEAQTEGQKLEANSNDITQFISVISAIAKQTNLLALNATIEAARAGEAGKGFAVVANEVKELARQSAHAADEITEKVHNIKTNSDSIMSSIVKVNELIENIDSASKIVASATEEQFATTEQFISLADHSVKEISNIGESSKNVNDSALNTLSIADKNLHISSELRKSSDELDQFVKKFKLIDQPKKADQFKMIA